MQPDESNATSNVASELAGAEAMPFPEIPGYRLQRRLGQGGMAVVYLAVQHSLDREVAIKVLANGSGGDEAQSQRFEHEARVIAKLEHPGIVGIHEVGRTGDGQLYYVMPYLARGDLSQRHYENEARIVDLLRALLDALGYAHARGIVHRDVKAENVLFNNADRPQLTDFGIALSRSGRSARITSDGLALGSGGYMSPEQARGEPVDGRADLYSLGVLTYELLTGELPYEAEDPLALALLHATEPVPRLPAEKAHWQAFIDTAMAKSPDKRFRNAQAMARALDALARERTSAGWRATLAAAPWWRPAALFVLGLGAALLLGRWLLPQLLSGGDQTPPVAVDASPPPTTDPVEAAARAEQLGQRLQQAQAQLAAGDLVTPANANAAESFLAVLRADPLNAEARDGLDRVVTAMGERVVELIDKGQREPAREAFEQARLLAEGAQLQDTAVWGLVQTQTRVALQQRAQAALAAHEGSAAETWLALTTELGLSDASFDALRQRIAELPKPGAAIRDARGPELSFIPAALGNSRLPQALAMMRHEVTRGEYAEFVAATSRKATRCRNRYSPLQLLDQRQWNDPGFAQSGADPVVCVSFDDARAYAVWLSRRSGQTYRLPTLQEWRHAVQDATQGGACARGNELDRSAGGKSAHGCSDGAEHTRAVRSYRSNRLQLFDLVGNASEWTLACGEASNPIARALENESCPRRAAAGTSWRDGKNTAPATMLQMLEPERGYDDVGFRLVREL